MNDEDLPHGEPDDAWVRDLLADARVTDPAPADVVARLDDTLAALSAERRAGGPAGESGVGSGVVVPLRRRLGPLLAAAVVVVASGGLGIARLAQDGADSTAGSTASEDRASVEGLTPGASASGAPAGPSQTAPQSAPHALKAAGDVPRLTSTAFAQDAARLMVSLAAVDTTSLDSRGSVTAGAIPSPTAAGSPSGGAVAESPSVTYSAAPPVTASPPQGAGAVADTACAGPTVTDAVTVSAFLDDTLVALVFRAPTDAAQRVEAWSCDGTTLLASASVPR